MSSPPSYPPFLLPLPLPLSLHFPLLRAVVKVLVGY